MPLPTSELVAVEWVKRATGLAGSVATTLPSDNSTWAVSGFVTVMTVGGTPHMDVPRFSPVLTCSCWAHNPNSSQMPWGKAADIAYRIWQHTQQGNDRGTFPLRAGYGSVRIDSVIPGSEPIRISNDPAGYARYDIDIQVFWVAI